MKRIVKHNTSLFNFFYFLNKVGWLRSTSKLTSYGNKQNKNVLLDLYKFRTGSKGYTKEQFIYASKLCNQSSDRIKEKYDILVKRYF